MADTRISYTPQAIEVLFNSDQVWVRGNALYYIDDDGETVRIRQSKDGGISWPVVWEEASP